jgi:poly(3-hydroxybutyrate) depolymerase
MQKMTRIIRLALLFALLAFVLVTCQKDPESLKINVPKPTVSIADFDLVTNILTGDSVSVSWTAPYNPNGLPVIFDISLNDQAIVQGQATTGVNLGGLQPRTSYKLKVTAKDSLGKATASRLDFTTPSQGGKFIHIRTSCESRQREYGYYLPSGIAGTSPPLVVYLHGAGGIAWPELVGKGFADIAEREKFILAMPQALKGTISGETVIQWNAHDALAWDDALFINTLIDTLIEKYNININKIYVSGMSNGGFMTFYMAGRTDRFAAIAPMSGLFSNNIFSQFTTDWPMPLVYIHGTADSIVRYDGGSGVSVDKMLKFWVQHNGCDTVPAITNLPDINPYDGSTVTLYDYQGQGPRTEIRLYKINGGGHSVAGYEPGSNQDIKAFEVIWAFFKTKSR